MSKSIISFLVFLALVLVVFVGSSIFANLGKNEVLPVIKNSTTTTSNSSNNIVNNQVKNPAPKSGITMTDVQKHNNQSSCWTVVNNGVYDLTSFVSAHPGGSQAILSLCGIDGTSAFLDQHGNQRRPNNELVGLKIGDLTK
jgi:cytochrome b involved in lipid metabolism